MSTGKAASTTDPSTPANATGEPLLRIDVDQVQPYDQDPRHQTNPEYPRIKASIRAQGMDQPLVVTRRPGETAYMVGAGGNTRLRISQELYQETGDARFREVACVYRPWTGETDVLLAHLRENDLRGELTFLDKAVAVQKVRVLMQQEREGEHLTQMNFAESLRQRGYTLSQGLISQMEYTVERLLPLLPTALGSGMGRPQIERIRQLERASRALWLERSVDTEAAFDQAFATLCKRYDSPEWDVGNLRRALEAEIAERADVSIHAVSISLDGYLAGRRGEEGDPQWSTAPDDDDLEPADPAKTRVAPTEPVDTHPAQPADKSAREATSTASHRPASSEPNGLETSAPTNGEGPVSPRDDESTPRAVDDSPRITDPGEEPEPDSPGAPMDLKSLRARAWTLASRLAQRHGLGELVQPLAGKGLGFILRDVPDPALVDQLDEDTLARVSMLWWHLTAAAELTVAPLDHLLPALAEDSVLRRALEDQDAGLLFSSVWTLDPGHMGYRLWRRLDDRDWHDLMGLMETYRALHRSAEDLGVPLWQ